ncbi:Prolyl endopeptidase [Strongyloides ratti]|uniref:Prolyl endopeptidase n=1 Tax=Strongyloides ratti TaxID=34506 RepID=A0A090L579_STRRB|nr:Prolyl endopeptidase [Strongyloides ratti]CEF64961.1 Prolyl endopeptidase [Strongyloides ratti]
MYDYSIFEMNSFYKKIGKYYYYYVTKNSTLQAILRRTKNFKKPGKDFINVHDFDKNEKIEIIDVIFSKYGDIIAYKLLKSDNSVIIKFKYKNGKDLKDEIKVDEFSDIAFFLKDKGFIYSFITNKIKKEGNTTIAYDFKNQLYYHKFGTSQKKDKILKGFNHHSNSLYNGYLSNDGKYLFIEYYNTKKKMNLLYFCPMKKKIIFKKKLKLKLLILKDSTKFSYIDSTSTHVIVFSKHESISGNIMKIKIPRRLKHTKNWKKLIKEKSDDIIKKVIPIGKKYLVLNFDSYLKIYDKKKGKLIHKIPFNNGTIQNIWGNIQSYDLFISFSNLISPQIIYRINLRMLKKKIMKKLVLQPVLQNLPKGINKNDNFKIKNTYYTSKDGTKIPLLMIYKNNIVKNKQNPVILEIAGDLTRHWDITESPHILLFIKHFNGIWCMAGIRGTLGFSFNWLNEGVHLKRNNSFDDLVAGVEFLINNNYTSPEKLGLFDNNGGGVAINVISNQRPDLLGAVVSKLPALDLLHIDEIEKGKNLYKILYGDSKIKADYDNLISFSPYENIRICTKFKCQFPSTLIFEPLLEFKHSHGHVIKYLAKLYHEFKKSISYQTNPVLGFFGNYSNSKHDENYRLNSINERINMTVFLQGTLNLKWID